MKINFILHILNNGIDRNKYYLLVLFIIAIEIYVHNSIFLYGIVFFVEILVVQDIYNHLKKSYRKVDFLESKVDKFENHNEYIPVAFLALELVGSYKLVSIDLMLLITFLANAFYVWFALKIWMNKKQGLEKVKKYISEKKIKVAFYLSGKKEVAYQLEPWIKVMDSLDIPYVTILRNHEIFDKIKYKGGGAFLYANSSSDLESILNEGIEILLYPNNRQQNVNALRHAEITHVFVNHGESDKAVNQSKLLMAYDYIFASGELAKDRMLKAGLKIRENQVKFIGKPLCELTARTHKKTSSRKDETRTIVYAPTWEGGVSATSLSSINEFGMNILLQLSALEGFRILFKPHPLSGETKIETKNYLSKMIAFCKSNGIDYIDKSVMISEILKESDILISDVSAIVSDFLYDRKLVLLTNIHNAEINEMHEEFPSSKACTIITSKSDIGSIIDNELESAEHDEAKAKIIDYIVGPKESLNRLSEELKFLMGQ